MRKTKLALIVALLMMIPNAVNAHPPSDLTLSYDLEKQTLYIKMRHTTHDPREDYIRKMEVSVNGQEPILKHYTIQLNTLEFSENVSIPAKEGDSIRIKAFSKEGGSSEATMLVPKKEEKKSEVDQPITTEEDVEKKVEKSNEGGY